MSDAAPAPAPAVKPPPLPPSAAPGRSAGPRFLLGLWSFAGSYALAILLLLVLMVLTFLGTIEQGRMSLYDVQVKYFESLFLVQEVGPVHVPLPGAALVLALLSVNLVIGGMIRLRRGKSTLGVLVTHIGIFVLFGSGLVEAVTSHKGQVTLYEGESAARFSSYYEWELAVRERKEGGVATEYVLDYGNLADLEPGDRARFTSDRLPFDVLVSAWVRNGRPEPGGGVETGGWRIVGRPAAEEAEANVPGGLVTLEPKSRDDAVQRTWLWGAQQAPWAVTSAGRTFELDLRRRTWELPFSIQLTRFVRRLHPGTGMAAEFSSYVTKTEQGSTRDVHITMNEPLRHRGYTLYQSGWGPPDAKPGARLYSTFAVVKNPSDRWPIIACTIIGIGLILHFGRKLFQYTKGESRQRARLAEGKA